MRISDWSSDVCSSDLVDVAVRVAGELRRQRMRAEESGADLDAERVADLPRDAQHLAFVVEVQAVAGLDLQRGHAVGEQRACARQRLRQQLVRSEEHTSEIQSLMRISYAVFCLKKKKNK